MRRVGATRSGGRGAHGIDPEVVEVARAATNNPKEEGFGTNVAGVPHGAKILFEKSAGIRVPWDDDLRVLETKEVLATVQEISEEEIV